MTADFRLLSAAFHVLPMRTRFPFRYGIASMCAVPHLFVSVRLLVNEREVRGLASEGLPPKWFTKDPHTTFEQDLAEMIAVIQNATRIGLHAAAQPVSFFHWWRSVYDEQCQWAAHRQVPPLLANFGVSLIERAVLEGLCQALGQPVHRLLPSEALGIDLGAVRAELQGQAVPVAEPIARIHARHTVGLADPLRVAEIPEAERLDDGLPQALEDCIRAYGLRYFKIKVGGQPDVDLPRLREITQVLTSTCTGPFHCTLDGNEQFHDLPSFRAFYDELASDPALRPLMDSLLLIEQPIHRSHALAQPVDGWREGPALIIDESDGSMNDLPTAIQLGYRGVSHKNCKGIVKGLANSALLRHHGLSLLSGEDLVNVGPVALLQDLAMMAALGVTHVERNGHHYFRGLSMHSEAVQSAVLAAHPDLYARHERGFARLNVRDGALDLTSVNAAPFGLGAAFDPESFETLAAWIKRGGMAEL